MSKLYIKYGTFYDLYYRKLPEQEGGLWVYYHRLIGKWNISAGGELTTPVSELQLIGNNFKLK